MLAAASASPDDPAVLEELARTAQLEGEEERALPILRRASGKVRNARVWQWKGLLERSLDEHEEALHSFAEAARLAPGDMSIAHGRARVAMEAGLDAQPLYEQARALAPNNAALLVGLAAARAAAGNGEQGAAELDAALRAVPQWLEGHQQLAQLMATLGRPGEATRSLEQAIARTPASRPLWECLLHVERRRGAYASLRDIVERAEAAGVHSPEFPIFRAIHAAEFDPDIRPPALFDGAPADSAQALDSWRIRHLLRLGEAKAALPLIDRAIEGGDANAELWAYASTAWRMTDDPRLEWLEGDSRLVSVMDMSDLLPPIDRLADTLRSLHTAKGEYLDQSVRGGTQTDGPLFCRIDPVIRQLRAAVTSAVQRHVAQLPPIDPSHPVLRQRRDRRVRFSGSWSVRLRSGGHHANHVHPLGWLSSALYVALPAKDPTGAPDSGWLTLGQPDEKLGVDLPPRRTIEPIPGRLVLFPSGMWHGTVPFAEGQRLTVAFDVAPPR